jgi:transcription initiation factor TFIIE subunit alpha
MDLAKTLIRCVARAFHETRYVLVVDALIVHSAYVPLYPITPPSILTPTHSLRDDDLAHLLGMQTKELRKLCAKLEEDRLLTVSVAPSSATLPLISLPPSLSPKLTTP